MAVYTRKCWYKSQEHDGRFSHAQMQRCPVGVYNARVLSGRTVHSVVQCIMWCCGKVHRE